MVVRMNGDLCTILAKSGIQDQTDGYARRKEEKKCSHLLVLTHCHSRTNISTLSYRGSFANLLL